jgi:hypothetical protein
MCDTIAEYKNKHKIKKYASYESALELDRKIKTSFKKISANLLGGTEQILLLRPCKAAADDELETV